MLEFQDPIPDALVFDFSRMLWAQWDVIKGARVKLRWGVFRPSFRLEVLEPVVVKLIGPRAPA
jgi:hypothetical protein